MPKKKKVKDLQFVGLSSGGWTSLHWAAGKRFGIVYEDRGNPTDLRLSFQLNKGLNKESVRPKRVAEGMRGICVEAGEAGLGARLKARVTGRPGAMAGAEGPAESASIPDSGSQTVSFTYWVVTGDSLDDYDW